MPDRRILSLWFPRLGAERLARRDAMLADMPLAVAEQQANMQVITALNAAADGFGLHVGQPVRDAHAMCPALITRPRSAVAEATFLSVLQRWAGKFSPWVTPEGSDGLVIDLTGCAHLFGGEEPLLGVIEEDCHMLGLTVLMGLADTRGAAWALARFAGQGGQVALSGDLIDQEARATRSRAGKRRHWTKGGAAPPAPAVAARLAQRIAPPGQLHSTLGPLPVSALRLEAELTTSLNRLGLRCISDLLGQPRASLARRFGKGLVLRLDQAMGSVPEPVSPARPPDHFAVRMTFPEPIGLTEDVMAAVDRLLPQLCKSLEIKGRGVRRVMLQAFRTDHAVETIEVGLARPTRDMYRIRPLFELKLDGIDAGFGIDMLRLEATHVEPMHAKSVPGHAQSLTHSQKKSGQGAGLEDLMGRLGTRVGLEAIGRFHPADSNVPEKTYQVLAAAWSDPCAGDWPKGRTARPLQMWMPEPVTAPATPRLPQTFRWRGQSHTRVRAIGPERIAPEWWLDDPNWRSGVRDYWVTETESGQRLWLFFAHGATMSAGWFCQGSFA